MYMASLCVKKDNKNCKKPRNTDNGHSTASKAISKIFFGDNAVVVERSSSVIELEKSNTAKNLKNSKSLSYRQATNNSSMRGANKNLGFYFFGLRGM